MNYYEQALRKGSHSAKDKIAKLQSKMTKKKIKDDNPFS